MPLGPTNAPLSSCLGPLQVNALQRHSLERELNILNKVRHGAIIRAGAIVEDDGSDNPIPMLYIEVGRVRER